MGSSSSRQGSRPRPNKNLKHTLSSLFICGSSTKQMEDDSMDNCLDHGNPMKLQRPTKEFALASGARPKNKNQTLLENSVVVNENPSPDTGAGTSVDCRSVHTASTSNQYRGLPHPNFSKGRVEMSFVDGNDGIVERITQSENEIPEREVILARNCSSEPIDSNCQETLPLILGRAPEREEEQQRDETVQQNVVTSVSSDNLSRATAGINNHELRLDARRLIWDAFLRESSERRSDTQTLTFSSDDSDDSGSGDLLADDSFNGQYLGSRTHNITERQQRSSFELRESTRRVLTGRCPSGLHSYGTCFCDPALMADDARPRASLSRIVMLAETLFEVLDEIQRHPLSLPLSMVSLPAPDSVVDSLPVKNHKVEHESESDIEQCQICLAEYEEGDEIRVLPCQHEYHVSCVDKWLKEVHRVCPLCRGDVCEAEAAILSSEIPLA